MRRFASTGGIVLALVTAPVTTLAGAQASGLGWSISPAENPTATGGQLTAVACPTANDCTAVGVYSDRTGNQVTLAEQWNGTAWAIQTTPRPANQVGGLEAVACPAPSACTAVGYAYDSAGVRITLAERWNGTAWAIQPTPNPAGAEASSFAGVACASISACTAVGSYTTSAGTPVTLAEDWDGTSWAIQATPNPAGATSSSLAAVACTSADVCSAVGSEVSGTNPAGANLAEQSASAVWTIAVTPTASTAGPLAGVSCTDRTDCVAVGRRARNSETEIWNGIRWRMEPNHLTRVSLDSVTCLSLSFCMAAGSTAALWGGSTWAPQAIALPPGSEGEFTGVSCSSTSACTLVGSDFLGALFQPVIERWNGTSWSTQRAPAPPAAVYISTLLDVSCASSTRCIAVGFAWTSGNDEFVPIAERWNGQSWSMQSVPNPGAGSAGFARLNAVSCVSNGVCMAVGTLNGASFAERWNGKSWSIESIPNATEISFESVSCASPTMCTAAGTAYVNFADVPAVGQWNGTSWSTQTLPVPAGSAQAQLLNVSCSGPAACVAVGYATTTASGVCPCPSETTLAEQWNGISWAPLTTPNPPGASTSQLNAVACTSVDCTAVGFTESASAVSLAEQWNGTSWAIQPTPTPSVPAGAVSEGVVLDGVSCTAPDACAAVGSYGWGYTVSGSSTLADRWDGTAWVIQPTPNPIGTQYGVGLNAVSCATSDSCMAAGSQRNTSDYEVTVAEQYSA